MNCLICGDELGKRDKKYCQKCRKDGLANKEACKSWYITHKEEKRRYEQSKMNHYRAKWNALTKNGCFICGDKIKRMGLHETSGKVHPKNSYCFFALHAEEYDFVPLCVTHHQMIHYLIRFFKLPEERQQKTMAIVEKALI